MCLNDVVSLDALLSLTLFSFLTAGILFTQMKGEVDEAIKEVGPDNPPHPAQLFTIKHAPGDGNVHLVQKVFKGPFEA